MALAAAWTGVVVVVLLARYWRLSQLVDQRTRVDRLSLRDFAHDEFAGADVSVDVDEGLKDRVAAALRSSRLVLLCGPRASGRDQVVFEVLRAKYRKHVVLRPKSDPDAVGPPLAPLLTAEGPWLPRRCILWLDDISDLLAAGFDPRIVERWLALGRNRAAIATITPADLQRMRASVATARIPLERAEHILIDAPHDAVALDSVKRELDHAAVNNPAASMLMRVVATWDILGLPHALDPELALDIAGRVTGRPCGESILAWALRQQRPLVMLQDAAVAARGELVQLIEEESRHVDPKLLGAFSEMLADRPGDLLAIGRTLGLRGDIDAAEDVLLRAGVAASKLGMGDLSQAVMTALINLKELKEGPSGARLSKPGGLDFQERMGSSQRAFSKRALPKDADDAFDPALPPKDEQWRTRFYRLTVRRAVARVATLMLLDAVAVASAAILALAVRADERPGAQAELIDADLATFVASAVPLTVVTAAVLGLYRSDAQRARLAEIVVAMTIVATIAAAAFLATESDVGSIKVLVVLLLAAVAAAWLLRSAYDGISRAWVTRHRLHSRVLLLGPSGEVRAWAHMLKRARGRPLQVVAYVKPDDTEGEAEEQNAGVDDFAVGTYKELDARLHDLHINELVIVDRTLNTVEKARYISCAHRRGVGVRYVANDDEIVLAGTGPVDDTGLVRASAALLSPEALELKRVLDWLVVTATIPAWAAIILSYAVFGRLFSRGQPVFVSADRVGLGEVVFPLFRLRTRVLHPDGRRGSRESGRVEAFFERSGLDEIPQVFNVLRGEMSLVGPRPLSVDDVRVLTPEQRRTLAARPGITGRWQVSWTVAPTEADMRALDADYLRRWRVQHDLELLLRTPTTILQRGFYFGDTLIDRQRRQLHAGEMPSDPIQPFWRLGRRNLFKWVRRPARRRR